MFRNDTRLGYSCSGQQEQCCVATMVALGFLAAVALCHAKLVHFHQTYPGAKGTGNEVQYNFGYAIDDSASGLVMDRWEEKRGGVVKGAYSLLEPGGSVRTVDYQVDGGGGFRAIVKTVLPGMLLGWCKNLIELIKNRNCELDFN